MGPLDTVVVADVDIDLPLLVPHADSSAAGDDHEKGTGPSYVGLTDEQRAAKVEELRKKIAARKAERAIADKVGSPCPWPALLWVVRARGFWGSLPHLLGVLRGRLCQEAERVREIKRREDGQKAIETARELEALQRKREAEKKKKVCQVEGERQGSVSLCCFRPAGCVPPFAMSRRRRRLRKKSSGC